MILLNVSLDQVGTTDSIAAPGYRARAPLSLFKDDVCSRMSEQVFVQLIAPSASCYAAMMGLSILLKMITKRELDPADLLCGVDPYLALANPENFLGQ
jgi:hypothetical protein